MPSQSANSKLPSDFDYSCDKNRAIDGALRGRRKGHCRELPMHRCAGLAQARLSSIAAAVLMGLEAGWRAGGIDQCQDGTASRNPEIPKSPVRWGLGQCEAAVPCRMDAMSLWWREAMVYLFGICERHLLRPPSHQAVPSRPLVCLPSVFSARLREPAGIRP